MNDIEDISSQSLRMTSEQYDNVHEFLKTYDSTLPWEDTQKAFLKKYRWCLSKKAMRFVCEREITPQRQPDLIKKLMRAEHGVYVVSVVTSPFPKTMGADGVMKVQRYTCRHNCHFCPKHPKMPRSYLPGEPGVDRAISVDFDTVQQIYERLNIYVEMGHVPDKLEVIVLGGTWSEYPRDYRDTCIRDIYYGANTWRKPHRSPLTLKEEIIINETNDIHIIGLTLETRPDCIDLDEIKTFREYNCTRVQIGIQHTCNHVLKAINRGHTIEDSMKAIKLLLDNGYKVDAHIMPNLPGSNVQKDKEMFDEILGNENLQVDQLKVYPTSVVPYSVLEKQFKAGKYHPYTDTELVEVLLDMKSRIPEFIRLNRIVRDIPEKYISGGCKTPHMRQLLHREMKKRNLTCRCIRCRSVKSGTIDPNAHLKCISYKSSGGTEFFISHVSQDDNVLYGFCRLRIPDASAVNSINVLDEVKGCALVRELHVYGAVNAVNAQEHNMGKTQHRGIGKMLMAHAECIALEHGYTSIAVISGVGVRGYYRKLGYMLDHTFMKKQLVK